MKFGIDIDWRVWGLGVTVEKTYRGREFAAIIGPVVLYYEPKPGRK